MNQRRAPYFQQGPAPNYYSVPYQQQMNYPQQYPDMNANQYMPQNPNGQTNQPQQPTTPYEHFAKPKHPAQWYPPMQGAAPKQGMATPGKGVISYFQDKDGQLDLDKMLNTVGQMANTYHQVSPIFKGLGSFVKGFK